MKNLFPTKIVCAGLNYRRHAQELGMEIPTEPLLFIKPVSAIVSNQEDIVYPPGVSQLDFEGELAVVIGEKTKEISVTDSLSVVAGYTIANDVTARDLQQKDGQWTRAKSFDTFCPLLDKVAKVANPNELDLKTFLNGELRQASSTNDLIFSVEQLISFVSKVMTLNKGDILLTGTPAGIGEMKKGDIVRVEISELGTLENRVV